MSHDTEHEHSKHEESKEKKVSIVSFKNSFWLVVIIVGLFIAALNFIKAESGEEEGGAKETKEMKRAEQNTEKADTKAEQPKQTEPSPPDSALKSSEKM